MSAWSLPFPESSITSPFGYRTAPYKAFHTGVDFGWKQQGDGWLEAETPEDAGDDDQ